MIELELESPFGFVPLAIGEMVVCSRVTHVFDNALCNDSRNSIGLLSKVHPSCTGLVVDDSSLLLKLYFGDNKFAKVWRSCVLPCEVLSQLNSNRVSSDLCRYFDFLISGIDDSCQLDLFEETPYKKGRTLVWFNSKTWTFQVHLTNLDYMKIRDQWYRSDNKFPELNKYFSPLGEFIAQTANHFSFDII